MTGLVDTQWNAFTDSHQRIHGFPRLGVLAGSTGFCMTDGTLGRLLSNGIEWKKTSSCMLYPSVPALIVSCCY